jgi:predicted SAM-dependent methyltransferase
MRDKYRRSLNHLEKFEKYCDKKLSDSIFLEYGAGRDLYIPMILSTFGVGRLISIDLHPLAKAELLNTAWQNICVSAHALPQETKTQELIFTKENFRDVLHDNFRIEYQAPADAQKMNFGNNSIDFIYTNSVNEHIPPNILFIIVKECFRVLSPNGIVSFRQSYADQWSYCDNSITKYNFLRYSEKEWKKYNPPIHYQSRLRHKDYLKIYMDSGFEILEDHRDIPDDETRKMLEHFPIAQEFRDKYTVDELAVNGGWTILKKL